MDFIFQFSYPYHASHNKSGTRADTFYLASRSNHIPWLRNTLLFPCKVAVFRYNNYIVQPRIHPHSNNFSRLPNSYNHLLGRYKGK